MLSGLVLLSHKSAPFDSDRMLFIHVRIFIPSKRSVLVLLVRAFNGTEVHSRFHFAMGASQDHAPSEAAFTRDQVIPVMTVADLVILQFRHVGTGNFEIPASRPPA